MKKILFLHKLSLLTIFLFLTEEVLEKKRANKHCKLCRVQINSKNGHFSPFTTDKSLQNCNQKVKTSSV
jgi:hypothetical protein